MKKRKIHQFFRELDRRLQKPADVILTGAAAGVILGNVRPSVDIDFEIRLRGKKRMDDSRLESAIKSSAAKARIGVNYSQDIGHWSMINYLDYRGNASPYKTFGSVRVRVISPEHWTIGKMGRGLGMDTSDMVKVIRKKKISPERLVKLWARAFRASPISLEKGSFRDHVLDFLKSEGKKIWGKNFDPEKASRLFKRAAGLQKAHSGLTTSDEIQRSSSRLV